MKATETKIAHALLLFETYLSVTDDASREILLCCGYILQIRIMFYVGLKLEVKRVHHCSIFVGVKVVSW